MGIVSIIDGVKYGFRAAHTEEDWILPLRDAVDAVSFEAAIWKPGPEVPSIWELLAHATPYLEALVHDVTETKAREFDDWPQVDRPTREGWNEMQYRVRKAVDEAQKAVDGLTESEMLLVPAGRTKEIVVRIMDIAVHDAYHAGQIVKLDQAFQASRQGMVTTA